MFKYKGIPLEQFTRYLFDQAHEARQAAEILCPFDRKRFSLAVPGVV